MVTKKVGGQRPGAEAHGREDAIADHSFPNKPIIDWRLVPTIAEIHLDQNLQRDPVDYPPFTEDGLECAGGQLLPGKATGPDGEPNEVLILVVRALPGYLRAVFNTCLTQTTFSRRWKEARLVLPHKGPGKLVTEPSSFRPLCMKDSVAKLLERLILGRLNNQLDLTGRRSESQFGFRTGRFTIDAIDVVLRAARVVAI